MGWHTTVGTLGSQANVVHSNPQQTVHGVVCCFEVFTVMQPYIILSYTADTDSTLSSVQQPVSRNPNIIILEFTWSTKPELVIFCHLFPTPLQCPVACSCKHTFRSEKSQDQMC